MGAMLPHPVSTTAFSEPAVGFLEIRSGLQSSHQCRRRVLSGSMDFGVDALVALVDGGCELFVGHFFDV